MSDFNELTTETLEHRGILNNLKSRIRAEIYNSLDEQVENKPQLSNINLFINELIREYLEFNKYRYTLSVLIPETGQPQQPPFDRKFIATQLNIEDTELSNKIPLLYNIIGLLQSSNNEENKNTSNSTNVKTPNALNKNEKSERMTIPLPTEQNKDIPSIYSFSKKN